MKSRCCLASSNVFVTLRRFMSSLQSEKADVPTGKVNLKFWQEAGPIDCVRSHMKEVVLHEFSRSRSELAFLKFIAEIAQVLEKMVIVVAHGRFSLVDDLDTKLKSLTCAKWASKDCKLRVFKSPITEGVRPVYNI
uniref:FBD domain-containing protein n=1 Tax=Arundo donax TaxID=35708 RepID=A0A0A8Z0U3_ARUDO